MAGRGGCWLYRRSLAHLPSLQAWLGLVGGRILSWARRMKYRSSKAETDGLTVAARFMALNHAPPPVSFSPTAPGRPFPLPLRPPSPSCSFHRRCNPPHLHISNSALPLHKLAHAQLSPISPPHSIYQPLVFSRITSASPLLFAVIQTIHPYFYLVARPACCSFDSIYLSCCAATLDRRRPAHFGCGLVERGRVCKNGSQRSIDMYVASEQRDACRGCQAVLVGRGSGWGVAVSCEAHVPELAAAEDQVQEAYKKLQAYPQCSCSARSGPSSSSCCSE